jgi:hypothetical protein
MAMSNARFALVKLMNVALQTDSVALRVCDCTQNIVVTGGT